MDEQWSMLVTLHKYLAKNTVWYTSQNDVPVFWAVYDRLTAGVE